MPVQAETCTTGKPERRVCPDYITYKMMPLTLVVIVFKAIHVANTTEVHIEMNGEIQEGNNITLECSTNATDLTFSFQSTVGDNQDVNVAECVFHNPHFFFINETFLAMYNIHMTEKGCTLTIINLSSKQYGVYTCFETYPPKNKASVRVEANDYIAPDNTVIVYTSIGIGVAVCILVTIILTYCIRQKTHISGGPVLHPVTSTQRDEFDDNAGGPELHPVAGTQQDVSDCIAGGPEPYLVPSAQRDVSDCIAGTTVNPILCASYTELNKGNTQPSIEKSDEAHVQNGPDECTTGMKNITKTISNQETTMHDANDEQQNTPLLENASENINDIGPIIDTTQENKLDTIIAEKQDPAVDHLSAASSFFVQNIHEDEDGVHIDNTGQDQLHASEMTGQISPDDDPNDSIESHQPPGTTSLYRSGQKIQIKHRGSERDNQHK